MPRIPRTTGRRPIPELGAPSRADLVPLLTTAVLTAVLTILPVALVHHYYFIDDTAGGAYGQWYELGQRLRAGEWPMLSTEAWMAGNHIAEGQWGLYNPVVWVIALLTTVVPHAAYVATAVKLFFLMLGALGTYFLARTYGARPALAVLAGISVPVAGWTFYLDATAWVTNLEVWAYFPWVMWGVRRYVHHRRGLVPALVAGLLLVTVGYVQGTIMLVLMFIALGVEALVQRRWAGVGRLFLVGLPMGLMAVAVYLPGLLTSGVTVRVQKAGNTGFMTLTLNGLAVAAAPSGRPDLSGFWGRYPGVPYTYIAWFLPLALLVSARRLRALLPRITGPLVFGGIVLLWAAGPSELGPLRFPIRSTPWVALMAIVLVVVILSRAVDRTRLRARIGLLILATLAGFWLSYAAIVDTWKDQVWWGLACAIALVAVTLLWGGPRRNLRRAGAGALIAVTVGFSAVQTLQYAPVAAAFGTHGFPGRLSDYSGVLDDARGEAIVVGRPQDMPGGLDWSDTLWGSTWYLSDTPVANAYSPTGYKAFNDDLCMDPYYGTTCDDLVARLFTPDEATGAVLVDLMSIDTVQILADTDPETPDPESRKVPEGWHTASADEHQVTWVRDGETAEVGGPTWSTPGMSVEVLEQDQNGVRMKVDGVPAEGGRIVLSRLDWPGYRVSGGELADPTRGYLLTVDVPPGSDGTTVDVDFRPPGWELEVAAFIASVLLTSVLTVLTLVGAVRRRRRPARSFEVDGERASRSFPAVGSTRADRAETRADADPDQDAAAEDQNEKP